MATNIWFWVGFISFVLAMLALDLGVFHREAHEVRPKEAGIWVAVWVALAMLFAAGLWMFESGPIALTFVTGYVIEESLSVDNLFVMVVIFNYFAVPAKCQRRVLFYGILGALVRRGLVTGVRMMFKQDEEFDGDQNRIVKFVRKVVPMSAKFEGKRFFTVENGKRLATPLLLVLILVEFTDLVFAVDSIPAIFGITRDPFLVFTSNIFAVLGLRSMYFLLAAVIERFYLLKYGLALILSFIGVKMLGEHFFHVDILVSLGIVLATLAVS